MNHLAWENQVSDTFEIPAEKGFYHKAYPDLVFYSTLIPFLLIFLHHWTGFYTFCLRIPFLICCPVWSFSNLSFEKVFYK